MFRNVAVCALVLKEFLDCILHRFENSRLRNSTSEPRFQTVNWKRQEKTRFWNKTRECTKFPFQLSLWETTIYWLSEQSSSFTSPLPVGTEFLSGSNSIFRNIPRMCRRKDNCKLQAYSKPCKVSENHPMQQFATITIHLYLKQWIKSVW